MATVVLGLPEIEAAQGQKYLTVNQALRRLDALVNLTVFNSTQTAPPTSPSEGDRYIVASGATGVFAGQETKVAAYIGSAWVFFTPTKGWQAYDQGVDGNIIFNGTSWVAAGGTGGASSTLLGVGGATPDATNKLSVTSPGVLFNREVDDFSLTLNKENTADDLQVFLKTKYKTHAILGLIGDDNFSLRVSPDGVNFKVALNIDNSTGNVALAGGTADSLNALIIGGANVLHSNSSGSVAHKFSKGAATDDATLDFQTNFTSQAMIGLLGDNNLTIKAGSSVIAAIVDNQSASVELTQHPKFSGFCDYDQYSAAGSWFTVDINNFTHNDQNAITSNVFTAPHAGYYMFGGRIKHLTNGAVPTAIFMGFSINGLAPDAQNTTRTDAGVAVNNSTTLELSAFLKLSAGDTVQLQAQFVTNDACISANENAFFGHQVA